MPMAQNILSLVTDAIGKPSIKKKHFLIDIHRQAGGGLERASSIKTRPKDFYIDAGENT